MVSVIMNCYNSSQFLSEAINSVYAQTFKDWEIIFWDNASTDNTPEVAKNFDHKLRYFRSETTFSLGQARNMALEKAKGEYIAFLDCDDFWLPEKLEKQIAILEADLDAVLLYSNYFILKDNRKLLALKKWQPQGKIFDQQLCDFSVGILTVVIRRKVLDDLSGLFDVTLNLAEDFDFFLRILYNSKAVYQEHPVAVYRVYQGMSSIKFMDKWRSEITYVIDKFAKLYPDFENKHSVALNRRRLDLEYLCAKMYMKKGDLKAARRQINPIKFLNKKYFLLYFCSYMPVGLWNFITVYFIRKPF